MAGDAEKLLRARAHRAMINDNVNSLYNFTQEVRDVPQSYSHFKVKYRNLQRWKISFEKHHTDVISLVSVTENAGDVLPLEKDIYMDFVNKCDFIETVYYEIFDMPEDLEKSVTDNNALNVKLPKINLVDFDGDIRKFPSFIGMFNALIHENKSLSNIEKFNYLISILKGPPLALVKCTPLQGTNYLIAYNALNDRYNNKRLLATTYWKEIDNFNTISSDLKLRNLLDVFHENLSALSTLGFQVDQWSFILVNMLLDRLDEATLRVFELEYASSSIPTYENVRSILLKHCAAIEAVSLNSKGRKSSSVQGSRSPNLDKNYNLNKFAKPTYHEKSSFFSSAKDSSTMIDSVEPKSEKFSCFLCKQKHIVYQCPQFQSMHPKERYDIVKKYKACINCLATSHISKNCTSIKKCRKCQQNHHTLLHFPKSDSNSPNKDSPSASFEPDAVQSLHGSVFHDAPTFSQVLLSTVKVKIYDSFGNTHLVRGILDSGSQVSFITKELATKLNLQKFNAAIAVHGLDKMSTSAKSGIRCQLSSIHHSDINFLVDAVLIEKICDELPSVSISLEKWNCFSNLIFADPDLGKPGKIDILLGADVVPYILRDGRIVINNSEPVAVNTIFGWTIMGKTSLTPSTHINSFLSIRDNQELTDLDSTLRQFWSIEEVPSIENIRSPEDIFCEKLFIDTICRNDIGRYIVTLPFKLTSPDFGHTRSLALRRLHSLENRLLKHPDLYKKYSEILLDYLNNNHMEIAPRSDVADSFNCFYLPHSCVFREESSSTPVRIVFDGSSRLPDKISLNQALHTGPKLQKNLVKILLNFRLNRYAFCADIRQMYRMILVTSKQCDYLRLLWRFSQNEPIREFRLKTLPFGLICSPYLAIRTLEQLATDYKDLPLASNILLENTYIDDITDGDDSIENAQTKIDQLVLLLSRGGFELRKWCSNESSLLGNIPSSHIFETPIPFQSENKTLKKILGLQWDPHQDTFSYAIIKKTTKYTKRSLLSTIARIYDPLGYLTPCIILLKIFMQNLWTLGVGWDDPLSEVFTSKFRCFQNELDCFSQIKIPRYYKNIRSEKCELHSFCDASQSGYCASVYIRVMYNDDSCQTYFVCAKSKVSPLKKFTIVRLELCACVLLTKLVSFVLDSYKDKISFLNVSAWSDSKVALSWIKSSPHKWKTFVANRVSYIQERLPSDRWFYIPSKLNPADLGTRGIFPSELINNSFWFSGPIFLSTPQNTWEIHQEQDIPIEREEEAAKSCFLSAAPEGNYIDALIIKFSSLAKILRVIGYVLRFIKILRKKGQPVQTNFTSAEIHEALLIIVKRVQLIELNTELNIISSGSQIPKYLRKLSPFIDKDGLLRVGGRLAYSNLHYDKKFPILLPSRSIFTSKLIAYIHNTFAHCGINATLFQLVQMFWVYSAKKIIRSVISKCVVCFKVKPRPVQHIMGNLPKFRIAQAKAFSNVGVDLGGPFSINMSRIRGSKALKAYLSLYVCFATKAVHLELLSDLSADSFLMGLRRFIARRGRCSNIYSDCGTNFVASAKYLKEIMSHAAESENISWHFHPPSSPHMGGLWEGGIKSVKSHLIRLIGQQILTYEELNTIFIQIEAILNSRPLCPISTDPTDLVPLTPGHFLTLEPLKALPEPDLTEIKLNRLTRWQLVLRLHRDFWNRYTREYLHTLQQKCKWTENKNSVEEGSLVLIKSELSHPLQWPLGRIYQLHPGNDGVSRVATVKTAKGLLKRPLVKLCPLPYDN